MTNSVSGDPQYVYVEGRYAQNEEKTGVISTTENNTTDSIFSALLEEGKEKVDVTDNGDMKDNYGIKSESGSEYNNVDKDTISGSFNLQEYDELVKSYGYEQKTDDDGNVYYVQYNYEDENGNFESRNDYCKKEMEEHYDEWSSTNYIRFIQDEDGDIQILQTTQSKDGTKVTNQYDVADNIINIGVSGDDAEEIEKTTDTSSIYRGYTGKDNTYDLIKDGALVESWNTGWHNSTLENISKDEQLAALDGSDIDVTKLGGNIKEDDNNIWFINDEDGTYTTVVKSSYSYVDPEDGQTKDGNSYMLAVAYPDDNGHIKIEYKPLPDKASKDKDN